jgi:acetate kinase
VTDSQTVMCLNSGSSSLKFDVYEMGAGEERLAQGSVEGIGQGVGHLRFADATGQVFADRELPDVAYETAIEHALEALSRRDLPSIEAIGHRMVHGGPNHFAPERVTDALLADLRAHAAWAPLHIPPSLRVIDALRMRRPEVPQVVCFDTAFHATMPEIARRLPLPRHFFDQGVHKYGFHGLSYAYLLGVLGDRARGRLVMAHLGNGASMVACLDGRPMDTTMGMTPLGGFMMGTRSGDMDPGVLLYLVRESGYDDQMLGQLLDKESGLKGVSDLTADMRTLLERRAAGDVACAQAVEMFAYQARRTIGSLAAALGGLDRLVFTGGIGEHAAPVRTLICQDLAHLGIALDPTRNDANAETISASGGHCTVMVVPTNEELTIARQTHALVFGDPSPRGDGSRDNAPGGATPTVTPPPTGGPP